MTVQMRDHAGDTAGLPCRNCNMAMLYTDHDWHVWCADCGRWNGWFAGPFFAQPRTVPKHDPNGEPTLF